MKRWLLRWLIGGEDVYVAVSEVGNILSVHTDFEGADEDLTGRGGGVKTVALVVD